MPGDCGIAKTYCSNHCDNGENATLDPENPPTDDTKATLEIVRAWGSLPSEIKVAIRLIVAPYLTPKEAPKHTEKKMSTPASTMI